VDLLERERELTGLAGALAAALEGRGGIVLVEGAPGIGKTSLLRAAAALAAEAGVAHLRARATELERDFAYGCVRQLLEPAVARASGAGRARLFRGAAELSRGLFAPARAAASPPSPSPSGDSSPAVLHGLYWLLNNLADEGPIVLAIDDLQWADAESLRFLAYLAPRLDGVPLALLASARPGEGATASVARLAAEPETTVLRPAPLSLDAVTAVCERRLGAPVAAEFAAACRQATGGNPFYLDALLREAAAHGLEARPREAARLRRLGPAGVADAVLLRLSGAPAAATALVRALAVLGGGATLAEAAALAEIDPEEAAAIADLLAALAILAPGERMEFAHPIVREAVYADIGAHQRGEEHARAARVLAGAGASEERIAAQIAGAEPAGDPGRVDLLRRVATDALARGAPSAAVAWLARALDEPPPAGARAEVLFELGSAELRGAGPGAVDHLTAAVEEATDPALLAAAVRPLANALTMAGEADRAVAALEAAIPTVEAADPELALLLEAELAAHAQQASREARGPAARRLERHAGLGGATPGEALVLATLAFERARASGSAEEAAALMGGALADGRLVRQQEPDVVGAFYLLIVGLRATDALELAEGALDDALAEARARASIPAQAFALAHRALVRMRSGSVGGAETDGRTALELLEAHDIGLGVAVALGALVEALVEGGEVEEAAAALSGGRLAAEIPPGMRSNPLLEARGVLRMAQGRHREAVDDLVELGRREELWGGASPLASRWRAGAALALAAAGDGEGARSLAAEDVRLAGRWGAASGIGVALRALALAGGGPGAIDLLRESAASLERSPARLEHARALADLGAALRRANRRAEAREPLRRAVDLAERCGGRALAGRARTELEAAGGRSSDPDGAGLERLTASERRVAELAAQGLSNPEIAQALFVTRKTVETHLGHVYRKLGVAGRAALGPALASPADP
jgi:DNA-binding CsgD family transcriptional regulator